MRILATAALTACLFAPNALADGRNPGSVLIYTVHRSGPTYFTIISVTNTNTYKASPNSLGGTTDVHYEYANTNAVPGMPFMPDGCNIVDRVETLTPADTLSVLTACHNAFTPGGQEGYLVVSALDPVKGHPWSHDYLVGSEFVVSASGVVYSMEAIPFVSEQPKHEKTDIETTPNVVTHAVTLRVSDCWAAYESLRERGVAFLTPPVENGPEIRCFFRDPDGHLFELSEWRQGS
jgi:catechol 2,3-dioxygenase-like lactoylglutathione lyase family enzyme